jgi:site-specific DNA recombinase
MWLTSRTLVAGGEEILRAADRARRGQHARPDVCRECDPDKPDRQPDAEIIEISVPDIIEPQVFEQVQRQLHARNPNVVAPRVTTGPILLTGLAICATCGGGMMLRTGTSKGGRVYRYYTCSNCATNGKMVCKGRSIPVDKLDRL